MKNTFLLLPMAGLLALASAAQVPAKAIGTPQGHIALNPTVKLATGKPNLTNVKLSPGTLRKLVMPPVMKNPPGLVLGEQLLTGVIPNEGGRATPITVSGSKFGNVQSDVEVRINGIAAIITAMSDNQIQCIVPDKCGSGPVTVGVKGKWTSGTYFIYDWVAKFQTIAGASGARANANGSGIVARFHSPAGMCRDQVGYIYIADQENNCIKKMNNFGEVTTIAGSGQQGYADGQGTAAQFYFPAGVVCDNAGNVYVADSYNNRIRKIAPNGMVSTFAGNGQQTNTDGRGVAAGIARPGAMAFDGTYLYVASGGLRRIDLAGNVTTIPGVSGITGMVAAPTHELYLNCNTTIKRLAGNSVTIIAGNPSGYGMVDGYGQDALFSSTGGDFAEGGIAIDAAGNLYVADMSSMGPNGNMTLIRRIGKDGMVTTPGDQMSGYNSLIWSPGGLVIDNSGALYLGDRAQQIIHKITFQ
jgi:serine/threonine-protein kinase